MPATLDNLTPWDLGMPLHRRLLLTGLLVPAWAIVGLPSYTDGPWVRAHALAFGPGGGEVVVGLYSGTSHQGRVRIYDRDLTQTVVRVDAREGDTLERLAHEPGGYCASSWLTGPWLATSRATVIGVLWGRSEVAGVVAGVAYPDADVDDIVSVSAASRADSVAALTRSGRLVVWRGAEHRPVIVPSLAGFSGFRAAAISPNGEAVAVAGDKIGIYGSPRDEHTMIAIESEPNAWPQDLAGRAQSLCFAADGSWVAVRSRLQVTVFDARRGTRLVSRRAALETERSPMAAAPDGVLYFTSARGIERLDIAAGESRVWGVAGSVDSLAVSSDGSRLAAGTRNGEVLLLDTEDGRVLWRRGFGPIRRWLRGLLAVLSVALVVVLWRDRGPPREPFLRV